MLGALVGAGARDIHLLEPSARSAGATLRAAGTPWPAELNGAVLDATSFERATRKWRFDDERFREHHGGGYGAFVDHVRERSRPKNVAYGEWVTSVPLPPAAEESAAVALPLLEPIRRLGGAITVQIALRLDAPLALHVVRCVERAGVEVEVVSVFSARQAVAAAVLGRASRISIPVGVFKSRFNVDLLDETTCIEARRTLAELRRDAPDRVISRLTAHDVPSWQVLSRIAGCEGFSIRAGVLADFVTRPDYSPREIVSQASSSFAERLAFPIDLVRRRGRGPFESLWHVDDAFIEDLLEIEPRFEGDPAGTWKELRSGRHRNLFAGSASEVDVELNLEMNARRARRMRMAMARIEAAAGASCRVNRSRGPRRDRR